MPTKEKIGLVLSGGGARGAFELGVWKALNEIGIAEQITGFSGTSIGAINTALFLANGTMDEKESVWQSFSQMDLLDASGTVLKGFAMKTLPKYLPKVGMISNPTLLTGSIVKTIAKDGVFSQRKLQRLLDDLSFDDNKLRKCDIFSTITDLSYEGFGTAFIDWHLLRWEELKHFVLSSATIPVLNGFKSAASRPLHALIDGGVTDFLRKNLSNTPIAPLYAIGYRKFIVIYLCDYGDCAEQRLKENKWFGDTKICRIFPDDGLFKRKTTLVRMLEINPSLTKERIEAGEQVVKKIVSKSKIGELEFRPPYSEEINIVTVDKTNNCIKRGTELVRGEIPIFVT